MIIQIFIVLVISIVLRIMFIIFSSTDEYSHLWLINLIKRNKSIDQKIVSDSIIKGYRGYPPLPSFIISILPKKHWVFIGKIINIVYELLSILFVFLVTYYLFENIFVFKTDIMTPVIAITLLYGTAPILFPVSYTARLSRIGGDRTISTFLCLIYFTSFGIAFICDLYWLYIICAFAGILIILSSQFGLQYILFTSIILSIAYLNVIPIAIILLTILLAILIPRCGVKRLLLRKIDHYGWYIKANKNKKSNVWDRNRLRDIVLMPYYFLKDIKKFINIFTKKITITIVIYSMPILIIILLWFVINPDNFYILLKDKITLFIFVLSLSSIIIFIVTSLKPFLFLGQAERYFEHSIFYFDLIFILYIYRFKLNENIILWVILFQIILVLFNFLFKNIKYFKMKLYDRKEVEFDELISFLNKKKSMRILTIPTKMNFKIATHIDEKRHKYYYDNISSKINGIRYMDEDQIILHYIKSDFNYFKMKYGINMIIIKKGDIKYASKKGIRYNFKGLEKVFNNKEYSVYKL
ncbi:MAG: hypothetical protein JW822_01355 [Spirochaetales bacterium]|nr:hypothetical protein [Spirochaetales bacterium]